MPYLPTCTAQLLTIMQCHSLLCCAYAYACAMPAQTQEEVSGLQAKYDEAAKRVETVKTQLTTEHIQSTARLQQQNDLLREELEAMEVGGVLSQCIRPVC